MRMIGPDSGLGFSNFPGNETMVDYFRTRAAAMSNKENRV
jgi:hypothetical protein